MPSPHLSRFVQSLERLEASQRALQADNERLADANARLEGELRDAQGGGGGANGDAVGGAPTGGGAARAASSSPSKIGGALGSADGAYGADDEANAAVDDDPEVVRLRAILEVREAELAQLKGLDHPDEETF